MNRIHAPRPRIRALITALALAAGLTACAMEGGGTPDCGDGTYALAEGVQYCLYEVASPDRSCPPEAPYDYYVQSGSPGWALICADQAPDASGELTLPMEVCRMLPSFGCVASDAPGGGSCCPYSGSCSSGGHGGWAPRPERCPAPWAFDGSFSQEVDAWGCSYLSPQGFCSGGEMCCIE